MKTQISVGISNQTDGVQCGRYVAQMALGRLPEADDISFALLFASHPNPAQVLKGVNQVLGDVPLIGSTSAGEYTQDGYVEDGAGIMLIRGEHIRFHPLAYRRRWFGGGKLLGRLSGATEEGLGSVFNHRALVLFPDDHSMNLDGVVDKAMTETAMLYDIVGGPGPTIPAPPRDPAIFMNNKMMSSGMVGTEVLSQYPFGLALANGWQPISGPYRATHIDKRAIVKIDGRPSREVYEDFLVEQGYDVSEDIPHSLMLQYPIGVCLTDEECKVSVLMGYDARGALIVTSPPPAHTLIYILSTRVEAMTTAARRAMNDAMDQLEERQPAGMLFIDCMSRAMVLEEAYKQQRIATQESAGDIPYLGFRSHGVLARLQGQTAGHYECSVGACMIPE